jgi:hypothetical protein
MKGHRDRERERERETLFQITQIIKLKTKQINTLTVRCGNISGQKCDGKGSKSFKTNLII